MTPDGFEATFRLRIDRQTAWRRLTEKAASSGEGDHVWLPGFDSQATIVDADPPGRLHASKDDEPCAGTDIVVTLEDDEKGRSTGERRPPDNRSIAPSVLASGMGPRTTGSATVVARAMSPEWPRATASAVGPSSHGTAKTM